jgi:hypothetical protein
VIRRRSAKSLAAEAAFRARLEELGATLLEPEWLGCEKKHHVRCATGHDCYPMPKTVRAGSNPCSVCAHRDQAVFRRRPRKSVAAEQAFRERLARMGAELLEPEWLGSGKRHRVRCSAGHDCSPKPAEMQRGKGACPVCSRRDPAAAEAAFRARLAVLGAEPIGPYVNSGTKVHVRCSAGHDCHPVPNSVVRGVGPCRICARNDPATAEAAFRRAVAAQGAEALFSKWLGSGRHHEIRCANGHQAFPRPNDIQQGHSLCGQCEAPSHSVFYVLEHDTKPVVKFGITSRDGRHRLGSHRVHGYVRVRLLVTELPEGVARNAENAVKSALAMAGEKPVRGREYFGSHCLALILDIAGPRLTPAAETPTVREWVQAELFAA